MGNDSPLHLSRPNLHFNLQMEMPKCKLRSEMEPLNTLQPAHLALPQELPRGQGRLRGRGQLPGPRHQPRSARQPHADPLGQVQSVQVGNGHEVVSNKRAMAS